MKYLPLVFIFCCSLIACKVLQPTTAQDGPINVPTDETDPPVANYPIGNANFNTWIHSPLHPDNRQSVQFKLLAQENEGANRVELRIYEYEWYRNGQGLPSKRRRTGGQWGLVKRWDFATPIRDIDLAFTKLNGFSAGSNVEYIFQIYSASGKRTEKLALFDAGDSLWPNDKILLYATSRQQLNQSINLCFLPDTDYNANWPEFLGDVEDLIYNGYHQSNVIRDAKENWAFFYTRESVNGFALALDYTNSANFPSFVKDNIIDGIDAFGLLHKNEYSDGAYLYGNLQFLAFNLFTSESYNHGTAIHETAHAVFNLSDEYNGCACFEADAGTNVFSSLQRCQDFNRQNDFGGTACTELQGYDGQSWYMSEQDVYFATSAECEAFNRANGYEAGSCITFIDIDRSVSYRANQGLCIMQDDGDRVVRDFQQTCGHLIEDFYNDLNRVNTAMAPKSTQENVYGYEPTVLLELERTASDWKMEALETRYGIPAKDKMDTDSYVLKVKGKSGKRLYDVGISPPDLVKIEGSTDRDQVTQFKNSKCRVSIPHRKDMANLELYNNAPPRVRSTAGVIMGDGKIKSFPAVVKKVKRMPVAKK